MTQTRREFTPEFKREAVALLEILLTHRVLSTFSKQVQPLLIMPPVPQPSWLPSGRQSTHPVVQILRATSLHNAPCQSKASVYELRSWARSQIGWQLRRIWPRICRHPDCRLPAADEEKCLTREGGGVSAGGTNGKNIW